jgi:D-sedoheptulose 7-phosphate isomerase
MMTFEEIFAEHAAVAARAAAELPPVLRRISAVLLECLVRGGKVLACGNGGSAAQAQHLAAELVGRFQGERRALPALSLTADTATLTSLANDYGYERVFARQIEALARDGDVLFAISTSGKSASVVQAAVSARQRACTVIALTGARGGSLAEHADLLLAAPSASVARIQEMHALCVHALVDTLESALRARGQA